MVQATQSDENVNLQYFIEQFGEKEAREALGLSPLPKRLSDMEHATNLLRAHMSAIDGIFSAAWECDEVDQLVYWHSEQAKVLVAKLRRMGFGDGSSASYARYSALLRWYADHDNDAHDIPMLLAVEKALHDRTRLPEDSPLRQPITGWVEDFWAGIEAAKADRPQSHEAAITVVERQKELAAAIAKLRTPGGPKLA